MIRVAVRELVEFVLRSGNLEISASGPSRTVQGIKAHQWLQKAYGQEYQAEVRLSLWVERDGIELEIHGRADGVIQKETGICIDEIKSTTLDLTTLNETANELHWAQVKCYAYMYARENGLETIETQLTYYQLDHGETRIFTRHYTIQELEAFFYQLLEDYLEWAQKIKTWNKIRNESIQKLSFPYKAYRPGQRELVVAVYKTIQQGKTLFAQAPTGIGKTMGTLFPSLKALSEGLVKQIFYLTAKTMTRTVAEKALGDLQDLGLRLKRLTLTAKDKICFLPESSCDPEECSYARGYYDRVRQALEAIYEEDDWTRTVIEIFAQKYRICPFEFSLDLAYWADTIICDYNYIFDPRVNLRRFFLERGEYVFLVDEAHNLVDRGREMFSAELVKEDFLRLKQEVQSEHSLLAKRCQKVSSQLAKLKKERIKYEENVKNGRQVENAQQVVKAQRVQSENQQRSEIVEFGAPSEIYRCLQQFVQETERFLKEEKTTYWKEPLLELYFKTLSFLRTAELYDEHYVTLYQISKDRFAIRLFCLDPSKLLAEMYKKSRAVILFSATLSPMEYFIPILGGEVSSFKLTLSSPFPPENLCVMLHSGISTRFSARETSYDELSDVILAVSTAKTGNYLVFFPSYDYLQKVYTRFITQNPTVRTLVQTPGMTEEERETFLQEFQEDPPETLVGFALMGGIFGEGIDLTGSRLSGAVIVGVGLPQICLEREAIRAHFQNTLHKGFEFAYMYPGLNKVLQAVGRVIRTEHDRGLVVLVDDRFAKASYHKLFPKDWRSIWYVSNSEQIRNRSTWFWNQFEEGHLICKDEKRGI